jgi:outer membrane protein OmpA-like peptidoglycan-associated protein
MNKHILTLGKYSLLLAALLVGACATPQPPRELLDARAAFRKAQSGPAARVAPAELYEAKVALNDAEKSFSDDPESEKTYTLSYVAQRIAQRVDSLATTKEANSQKEKDSDEIQKLQSEGLTRSQEELTRIRDQLTEEKKARAQAEGFAREALQKVAEAAKLAVKQEERGTVIILPGSVLFESGQATLFPLAQQKLALLAEQLRNQKTSLITIEGHTDSRGTPSTNMELSQARADSVRNFIISQGIPSDRIRAVGMGETRPLASNDKAEGRAENRRVEIIVAPGEPK